MPYSKPTMMASKPHGPNNLWRSLRTSMNGLLESAVAVASFWDSGQKLPVFSIEPQTANRSACARIAESIR